MRQLVRHAMDDVWEPCLNWNCHHSQDDHRGTWCEPCAKVVIVDQYGYHEPGIHGPVEATSWCLEDGCECEAWKDEPSTADLERMNDATSAGERHEEQTRIYLELK